MQKNRNIRRLAAFTESQEGGNPAGVWLGDQLPQPDVMQSIAAKVGYSETVFIAPIDGFTKKFATTVHWRKYLSAAMLPSLLAFA